MVSVIGQSDRMRIKWKLTRSLYSIIGRDPPTRPQAEATPRLRPTIHFLGADWERAELIKLVALSTLPTLRLVSQQDK
jgi:hypothetical protein